MGSRPDGQKTALTTFFSPLCFTVYRGGPAVLFQRKLYFPRIQRGPTFSRGDQLFSRGGGGGGGANAYFHRNPYNL